MGSVSNKKYGAQIVYFESEGRQNLEEVLRVVKKNIDKREELRPCKVVIFTAEGQGPAMAYNRLGQFKPKLIAVTFPIHFSVKTPEGGRYFPRISRDVQEFFQRNDIDIVIPPSLPFDLIDGMEGHNHQVKVINQTIAMFGAGFGLCIQAVLRACDVGLLDEGETVIAMSGDTAGLFTASTSSHFLNSDGGLAVQEIFCKARKLTRSRPHPQQKLLEDADQKPTIEGKSLKS